MPTIVFAIGLCGPGTSDCIATTTEKIEKVITPAEDGGYTLGHYSLVIASGIAALCFITKKK